MMDAWASFWGWVLVVTLTVFAVLAIAVTIGGFFDVRAMFRSVEAQHVKGPAADERQPPKQ